MTRQQNTTETSCSRGSALHVSFVGINKSLATWHKTPANAVRVLLLQFVNGAKEMCFSLWTAGYWADFIDPTTGAAVSFSPRTPQSLHNLHNNFLFDICFTSSTVLCILLGSNNTTNRRGVATFGLPHRSLWVLHCYPTYP